MAGRPVGSKTKNRSALPKSTTDAALNKLNELIQDGNLDAILFCLEHRYPILKNKETDSDAPTH